MATVYIETSIVGYLTARPRRDVIFQARQELTKAWWDRRRHEYELVTSQLVVDEAAAGDSVAAQERLNVLGPIPLIDIGDLEVDPLARRLISAHLLPEKATADARHVAVSAVFGIEYLLTWNCKHLANADLLPRVYAFLRAYGYHSPLIVTPEEFSGHV